MGKSVWYIAIFGIIGMATLLLAMIFVLEQFSESEAGNQVKLAGTVREKFQFDTTSANVGKKDGQLVMDISYQTAGDGTLSEEAVEGQMTQVAEFAAGAYSGRDKTSIREIRVRRLEVRESGCSRETSPSEYKIANPHFSSGGMPRRSPSLKKKEEGEEEEMEEESGEEEPEEEPAEE